MRPFAGHVNLRGPAPDLARWRWRCVNDRDCVREEPSMMLLWTTVIYHNLTKQAQYTPTPVPKNSLWLYRVTNPLVQNLPLTSKQKFRFGQPVQAWPGQNGTFVLKSMGGFEQMELSPCTVFLRTANSIQINHNIIDPLIRFSLKEREELSGMDLDSCKSVCGPHGALFPHPTLSKIAQKVSEFTLDGDSFEIPVDYQGGNSIGKNPHKNPYETPH